MPDEWGGNFTPLDETLGIITPSALHYEVCRGGVPDIDPRKHRLLIHGMVDRPLILTMDEIRRLPSTSRILFLECAGNTRVRVARAQAAPSVQFTHGLTSCSEWTGVALSLLLREAGAQKRRRLDRRRGRGRHGQRAQHPHGEGDGRRPGRLRPERRGATPGERLPVAAHRSGLGRQRQRQVAASHQGGGQTLHDAHGKHRTTPASCRTARPDSSCSSWRRSR